MLALVVAEADGFRGAALAGVADFPMPLAELAEMLTIGDEASARIVHGKRSVAALGCAASFEGCTY